LQIWLDLVYVMIEGFFGGWAFFFFFRGVYMWVWFIMEQLNMGFRVYIWILHLVEREGEKREKKKEMVFIPWVLESCTSRICHVPPGRFLPLLHPPRLSSASPPSHGTITTILPACIRDNPIEGHRI